MVLSVSDIAASEIAGVLARPKNDGRHIRIRVTKGGCAGYDYNVVLDDKIESDDYVHDGDGFKVVADPFSLGMVRGSELDFNDELIGRGFILRNPNAEVTCGCGTSFNVKPRRSPMKYMRDKKEDRVGATRN
jgi:iron-sulfur cluster assembly accessory protein